MKNKKSVFPFVMGTLAFLCFLAVVLLMSSSVQPLWGRVMVLLLPSVILYAVAFLSSRGKLDSKKTVILTSVLTIVLLLVSIFYVFLLSIWTATTETTETRFVKGAFCKSYNKFNNYGYKLIIAVLIMKTAIIYLSALFAAEIVILKMSSQFTYRDIINFIKVQSCSIDECL